MGGEKRTPHPPNRTSNAGHTSRVVSCGDEGHEINTPTAKVYVSLRLVPILHILLGPVRSQDSDLGRRVLQDLSCETTAAAETMVICQCRSSMKPRFIKQHAFKSVYAVARLLYMYYRSMFWTEVGGAFGIQPCRRIYSQPRISRTECAS